jgi:hypothetical protein
MLNGILNYINCCKTSNILDKCSLKVENGQSTNEPTEKNNIPLNEGVNKIIIETKNKDSIITFSDTKVKQNKIKKRVLDTLVIGSRELILEGDIFYNEIIKIDKIGIKNENRINKNGIAIFGISDDFNDNCGIDFNLNLSKKKLKNKKDTNIPIFKIEYIKEDENYILSLINKDIKILLLIENDFLIDYNSNLNFMIGKIQIKIISPKNEKDEIFYVETEGKNYKFNKKELPLAIGRGNSNINIKHNSISKILAIIDFNTESSSLFIRDNESTNGTFFLIDDNFPFIYLLFDCTMKIFDSKFTIKIIDN